MPTTTSNSAPATRPAAFVMPAPTEVRHPLVARWTPTALAVVLLLVGLSLRTPGVTAPLAAAALLLTAWNALLVVRERRPEGLTVSVLVDLRKQHYVQACAQGTVLLYWGWYWPPVYQMLPLIGAQLLFAYAFDMLLSWTRRNQYTLGFSPFPVILSINLFLWFRPDWFSLQLLMVAAGFAAKEFIRWQRDGRTVHIFNPSSFPLAVASVGLILAGSSDLTRGQDIAISQFYPPHMYVLLFLIGLPGQFLFGVAAMTLSAVATTYLFGLVFLAATGTYFFYDSYIPIAVFLGMHLLFTDPSTSPRTELGRLIFGVLYGLTAVVLYQVLTMASLPAFYDKLLQVPLLNLSVRAIDHAARSSWLSSLDPARLVSSAIPRARHVAYMGVWILIFGIMHLAGGVGDRHPGQWVPFWQEACGAGRERACTYLTQLETILCDAGSGWACNESAWRLRSAAGRRQTDGRGPEPRDARDALDRGCRLGFVPACRNLTRPSDFERAAPALADYAILLRGSKGPVTERAPSALYARACGQGWREACERTEPDGPIERER